MDIPAHIPIIINNVKVFFPHEPYDTQKKYMESVIQALQTKQNALLESPTGTGKTLSLLCSSLAWLQSQTGTQSKSLIYYTSRTHLQLAQAAKEMKRTAYGRNPGVVIGSRAQMCLNDDVRRTDPQLINRTCRNAITKNACSYYTNYEQKLETMDFNNVHDIEDLENFGKSHQCCPYYASKKIAETKASIIFMPYNYLMEASVRKSTQLKIDNSIIIFDEAHNIEGVLKDCVSGSVTESSLKVIQESCLKLPAKIHEALNKEKHGLSRTGYDPKDKPGSLIDEFAKPKNNKQQKEVKVNPIEELAEKLTNDRLQQVNSCSGFLIERIKQLDPDKTSGIESLFLMMEQSGIRYSNSSEIIITLDSMSSFWSIAGVMNPIVVARYVSAISHLSHVVSLLFPETCSNLTDHQKHVKNLLKYYTVYIKGIYEESRHLKTGTLKDREVNLWCLHPSMGLKKIFESTSIFGPRSMIVTSGTLAPMTLVQKELGHEFKIQKGFEHIIEDAQLKMMIIAESPSNYNLRSHFEAAKKDQYLNELGKTLLPIFKVLPFGSLVFFPSYSFMDRVVHYWKNKSSTWRDLNAVSSVFIEKKIQDEFNRDILTYKRKTSDKNSEHDNRAIFFGVCRGKLSEGINLEGNQCRSVIIVGLPFPNISDPKIILTRKFHEKSESNNQWYSEQMRRALNQTIGRVIRSKTDFGMLLLCDPKFIEYKYCLSEWTRKFFPKEVSSMATIENDIKEFFGKHGICITQSATENAGAFEIGFAVSIPRNLNWSPFSEASSGSSNRLSTKLSQSPELSQSVKDKQSAMLAQYRVSRETYTDIKRSRLQAVIEDGASQVAKKSKSSLDVFDAIFSQTQNLPQSQPTQSLSPTTLANNQIANRSSNPLPQAIQQNQPTSLAIQQSSREQRLPSQAQSSISSITQFILSSSSLHSTQGTNSTLDYSITKQASDKSRPTSYKCFSCRDVAKNPHRSNCKCAKVGCELCIRPLYGRKCFKCGVLIKKRDTKPLLFKSAFFKDERQPVIVIDK